LDVQARLAALEEVRLVQARYWRYMDTKQWDRLRTVFTDDAQCAFPGERGGRAHGGDAVVGYIRDRVGDAATVHHGHQPEIEFDSPTTARGVWAFEDLLQWPPGMPLQGTTSLHGWGHYHNRYAKTAAGWRISFFSVTRLRLKVNGSCVPVEGLMEVADPL
jgi:hypothetical protein